MKKIVSMILVVILVMSFSVYAMADVLSVDEMNEKIIEYATYLEGEWTSNQFYAKALGGDTHEFTIKKDGTGISINPLGQVYVILFSI